MNYFKDNNPLYKGLLELFKNKDFFNDEHKNQIKKLSIKCECFFNKQLKQFSNHSIKYILIGEAPPFSDKDSVAYVYNPESKNTHWRTRILKAFNIETKEESEQLKRLRDNGFLLIDLFPYPAKFDTVSSRKAYKELIDISVEHYLPKKIEDIKSKLDKNVKVAFAMKRFGNHINKKSEQTNCFSYNNLFNKKLNLEKNKYGDKLFRHSLKGLSFYENIIADGSGNPNSSLIKYVFNL